MTDDGGGFLSKARRFRWATKTVARRRSPCPGRRSRHRLSERDDRSRVDGGSTSGRSARSPGRSRLQRYRRLSAVHRGRTRARHRSSGGSRGEGRTGGVGVAPAGVRRRARRASRRRSARRCRLAGATLVVRELLETCDPCKPKRSEDGMRRNELAESYSDRRLRLPRAACTAQALRRPVRWS